MPATASQEKFLTQLPVSRGRSCTELRLKFSSILEALKISPVSRSLAVSDFSQLYKSLADGDTIRVEIDLDLEALDAAVRLTVSTTTAQDKLSLIGSKLTHFRAARARGLADDSTSKITVSHQYRLSGRPDIQQISHHINHQTSTERDIAAKKTELQLSSTRHRLSSVESDLKIASDIQQHMLLSKAQLKNIDPHLDCHAYIVPCKEVGGDFFDIISLGKDRFSVVVGDVSGKGVPAAMMMATCSTLIRAYCETDQSPSSIVSKVNNRLLQGNEEDCMFTTLFLAIIDRISNRLTYCNAGHNPGLIAHEHAGLEELATVHGPAVGVFMDHNFTEESTDFLAGDRLILYTDGASESFNTEGELYGFQRIRNYCNHRPSEVRSRRFLSGLLLNINHFCGTELAHDDVTLVAIRRDDAPKQAQDRLLNLQARADECDPALLKQQVEDFCNELVINPESTSRLLLVLDELMANTLSHGQHIAEHTISLQLNISYCNESLSITYRDNAPAFNALESSDPDFDLDLEQRPIGGLGLFLVRSLTEQLSYHYDSTWNQLQFRIGCATAEEAAR